MLNGGTQRSLAFPGAPWRSLELPWWPLAFPRVPWRSLALPGAPWRSLALLGALRSLALSRAPWRSLALPGTPLALPGAPLALPRWYGVLCRGRCNIGTESQVLGRGCCPVLVWMLLVEKLVGFMLGGSFGSCRISLWLLNAFRHKCLRLFF